ncbi:hypothetical protein HC256_000607 [Beauveria bassiana]|nr:hypothetical protein HC256_000607 [Beauveria bassiana]
MIPTLPHAPTPFVLRLLFILQPLFLLPSTLPHDVSKAAGFTLVNHTSRTCHLLWSINLPVFSSYEFDSRPSNSVFGPFALPECTTVDFSRYDPTKRLCRLHV